MELTRVPRETMEKLWDNWRKDNLSGLPNSDYRNISYDVMPDHWEDFSNFIAAMRKFGIFHVNKKIFYTFDESCITGALLAYG